MYKILLVSNSISFMNSYQMVSCVPGTALEQENKTEWKQRWLTFYEIFIMCQAAY